MCLLFQHETFPRYQFPPEGHDYFFLLNCAKAGLPHLHSDFEEIIKTLCLSFRFFPISTPNVDSMPSYENCRCVWVFYHGLCHAVFEILLVWSILDNRDFQSIKIGQRRSYSSDADALDHLLMRDRKSWTCPKQGSHDRMLWMGVDATAGIPKIEWIPEQRCTCRFLQVGLGSSKKDTIGVWWLRILQDEDMIGFDALFLNPGRCDINYISFADANSSTSACDPSEVIKWAT